MDRKDLIESSNEHHKDFSRYVEENGFNELAKMDAEMKIAWLIMLAKKHGVELTIRG